MLRRLLTLALIAAGLAAVPIASAGPASAAPSGLPPGFRTVAYDAGMFEYDLTNFVTIPGTQSMLATGKSGRMTRVDIAGDGLSPADASHTILGNMPAYYQGDRGLLGISLAADYTTSGHVFLLWDYCQSARLASDDQACIPDGGLPTGRLSRMTLTGSPATPTGIDFTSEVVLLDNLPSWSPTPGAQCTDSHTIGTVVTAPDGTLFVGNGDGAGYCGVLDPASLSAQDITSPRGKIFHINPNGTPTGDDIPGSYLGMVWAYGLRNPFRFTQINDASHAPSLLLGDVGWNTVEEVDGVSTGQNMGWPCVEGNNSVSTGLINTPPCPGTTEGFTPPLVTWLHQDPPRGAQSAAVGGVLTPQSWGSLGGQIMYGDYARGDLFIGPHTNPLGALGSWGGITSIQTGLFGDVYVSDIGAAGTGPGHITRIHNDGTANAIPTVSISGAPLQGSAPLNVQWATPIATDTDGSLTTWSWTFGDNSLPAAGNGPPPGITHLFLVPGSYQVVLRVTDNDGASASATQTVNVGNNPPILTVGQPSGPLHVGDSFVVQAGATDPDNDAISIQYQPVIHHCPQPNQCHVHPGAFQTSPLFVFPSHGDDSPDYYLEIVVKATDARGAVAQASANYFLVGSTTPPQQPPTPPVNPPQGGGLRYTPIPPQRLLDTRQDGRLGAQTPLALNLIGHRGAVLNVTVTNPTDTGYLRVYPCSQPGDGQTSTVNYNPGETVANVTFVIVPPDGQVCLWSLRPTDAVVDLQGTFDTAGLAYTAVPPLRLFDTRAGAAAFGAGQQALFTKPDAPADAQAMLANFTVDGPQAAGYLRAYPCGAENNTSNVNYVAGQTVSNFAAVSVNKGTFCMRSLAQTDVIADLAGWFTPGGALFTAVQPFRLFDTRSTSGFTRLVGGRESRILLGLPSGTTSVVLNLTAADPSAAGYLQVYPCGTNPGTSSVNYAAHQVAAANMTVVQIPPDGQFKGQVCFKSLADTDLIVDVSGWFS